MARDTRPYSVTVDGTGRAVVTIRVSNGIDTWTVDQVSTEMNDAPIGSTCSYRLNGRQISAVIPTGGVVDGPPATVLRPQDTATIEWAGCTPGTTGSVLIQFDDGHSA